MACKCIPLCIESSIYKHAINEESIIQFKKDLSDFSLKVNHYINNDKERERIVETNYKIAIKNHSWSNRVDMILSSLDSCDF